MLPRTVPLLALLLFGCARPRPEPIVLRDSPWYPLPVGARWDYKGGALTMTRRVLAHDRVAGTPCAFIESRLGREVILREHVAAKEDGVYLMAVDGRRVVPEEPVLQVQRQDHQDAGCTGQQKNPLRKPHAASPPFSFMHALAASPSPPAPARSDIPSEGTGRK